MTCAWCSIFPATTMLYVTPTCAVCVEGGSRYRVAMSLKRWERASEIRRETQTGRARWET